MTTTTDSTRHLMATLAAVLGLFVSVAASAAEVSFPPAPHVADLMFPGVRHGAPVELVARAPRFSTLGTRPIVLVHGLGGSPTDFDTLRVRLEAAGVAADRIHAVHFTETSVLDSNRDDALFLAEFVADVLRTHDAERADLIVHSRGGVVARYYLKLLGGTRHVHTYVSLGTMHRGYPDGLSSPCGIPEDVETLAELCSTAPFMELLNRRNPAPGPTRYVSIYSTADTVVPAPLAWLEGAENVAVDGLDHAGRFGLLEDRAVFEMVRWHLTVR